MWRINAVNKAYKFRLYPNEKQKEYFAKTFGCTRFIYNRMLADKIKYYEENKKTLPNTPAQYKKEFECLLASSFLEIFNFIKFKRLKSRLTF